MKIKNPILAAMLTTLGVKVKAELIVDDSNGTTLTFPEITEISELAAGIAVDAPDGTYVIANEDATITIVVIAGVIDSIDVVSTDPAEEPQELDGEVLAVLEAVVASGVESKKLIVALQKELKDLKTSLKHDDGKAGAAAAQPEKFKFKVIG